MAKIVIYTVGFGIKRKKRGSSSLGTEGLVCRIKSVCRLAALNADF